MPPSACGVFDPGACVSESVTRFLRSVVSDALNPMIALLGDTLLATPNPTDLPRLTALWEGSWRILLACYGLLVLAAGIVLMGYETIQARHTLREIAPRLVIGFVAGAVSLSLADTAIEAANALSSAVLATGVEETGAAAALRELIESALHSANGATFLLIMGLGVVVALLALLLTYIVRVALTVVLVAAAPIALMFHALPHTEGIAHWWWRSFGACLAIQVVQSLTLVIALNVLLTPGGGFGFEGADVGNGFVTLLVVLALLYVLFKIPFWLLSAGRISGGRSLLGSLVRGFIAYKTFGLLGGLGRTSPGGRGNGRPGGRPGGGGHGGGPGRGPRPGPTDPYARTRATRDGQLMLPLEGLARRRPRPAAPPAEPAGRPPTTGRQLALPLTEGEWPENRPVLGRDGQYRLPITVTRARPTAGPAPPMPRRRSPRARQLALPLTEGDWPEHRPVLGPDGQYRLPISVTRVRPATAAPAAAPAPAPAGPPARRVGRQMSLPFDPRQASPALRAGRYPVPTEGAARRPAATPPTPARRSRPGRAARTGTAAAAPSDTASSTPRRRRPGPPGDLS
ncbi:hypothetical protein [Pseudonocardia sp.]|uniref:hypothetical protein n=1 Tax=Pseudonocardia sp. TaxID=60912 RepID=UPI003D117511